MHEKVSSSRRAIYAGKSQAEMRKAKNALVRGIIGIGASSISCIANYKPPSHKRRCALLVPKNSIV